MGNQLTSGALHTSVPACGSLDADAVPQKFFRVTSSIVRFAYETFHIQVSIGFTQQVKGRRNGDIPEIPCRESGCSGRNTE
jgi:hypothetical protein